MSRAVVLTAVLLVGASAAPLQPGTISQTWWRHCELLDMTYSLSNETTTVPIKNYIKYPFELTPLTKGMVPGVPNDYYLHVGKFCSMEHFGTHLDAPNHVLRTLKEGQEMFTLEKVPLTDVIGEACVIDVPEEHKYVRSNYKLTIDDIKKWEEINGLLHEDCIVIIRTGQERFWDNQNDFLGTDTPEQLDPKTGFPNTMAWPGLGVEAAEWILANRGLKAIGADSISFDAGDVSLSQSVHTVILGANKPGFENLALVSKLPARGATLIGLPIKNKGGSGGPVRVMAYGWNGPNDPCRMTDGAKAAIGSIVLFLTSIVMTFL
uniref:Cyclase n=1 Tax=Plectus sambesii TaxID=2011161 RepID=A0A914WHG8_9BILA